ncbi:MAG: NADH-ubiquinone oxidoreductase-F iron-sulfur binding region domain-containing protein, partial [Candidatus Eremiobacterales bacterium]
GAKQLHEELARVVAPEGEPFASGTTVWVSSPCLGLCDKAPAALSRATPIAPATMAAILGYVGPVPSNDPATEVLSTASGAVRLSSRALSLGDLIRTHEGARLALRRAFEIGSQRVIEEVKASKLMGRGGAAFPTGRKWEAVAHQPEWPHYIVCNADESEPGTFKDLKLMLDRAPTIVEAMTIAAYAGNCGKGFIYVRGEYPQAMETLRSAVAQAHKAGALGKDIFGSGFDFDIEIRRGAGAYICGEETALFNSIEGYRGEPRNKPPFPVQKGLFGKPTIVNNVETLVNIPDIILEGGEAYAKIGTPESTGTKLFCLSGCVTKPGVYEVPFGTTLRALIDMAGGVRGRRKLQAVLLGGAAGTFLTPDEIDVPLSFEGVRAIKATLGSGVVMLFDDRIDLRKIVARIARFFRDESCGQCVPCRVGTVRQEELLERLATGASNDQAHAERALLGEIGQAMRDASICGLGQTASSAVESAIAKFDLFGTKAG